jgi:hypothetical protein
MFLFGISYNVPQKTQNQNEVQVSKPGNVNWEATTVDYGKFLSDQNS